MRLRYGTRIRIGTRKGYISGIASIGHMLRIQWDDGDEQEGILPGQVEEVLPGYCTYKGMTKAKAIELCRTLSRQLREQTQQQHNPSEQADAIDLILSLLD